MQLPPGSVNKIHQWYSCRARWADTGSHAGPNHTGHPWPTATLSSEDDSLEGKPSDGVASHISS